MRDKINNEISEAIFKFFKQIKPTMSYDSKAFHLTMVQFEALICLKNNSEMQMKDIANCFSITMPSATALVDKLIEMKFAARSNDKNDRRIVKINLTKQGEKLLEEAMKQRRIKVNKFLASLSIKDKEDLLRILHKVANI